ncbi:similar to Ashbya gossypii ACR291Cp hypothetical protein [Maudiozyma saulgeensis]|uniref:LDB19 N-terminal domain-containing protein n=1 Tax=Maudiozyma saulgeensis TaxID=1789683 RepID=A0A1X7R754_9SACH|nr:similar to Ashbya gossypii ACR291Cp hypothetical protein [Kazachstania saulgeensis]
MSILKSFTSQLFNISNSVGGNYYNNVCDTNPNQLETIQQSNTSKCISSGTIVKGDIKKPISSKIYVESPNCTLFDIPQSSIGSLFSATFSLIVNSKETIEINVVTVELVQHIIIQQSLSPTCKFCKNSLGSIKKIKEWNLLIQPSSFKKGEHKIPFSCHIEGSLPATSRIGTSQQTNITYELLTTIKYHLKSSALKRERIYTDVVPFEISRIFRNNRPKLSQRTFEPTTTLLEGYLPETVFVNTKNFVKLIIRNINKDLPNKRWSIKNINCYLFEIVRYESIYCSTHDREKLFKKLLKQTKEQGRSSIFEKIQPNKSTSVSYFERTDIENIDQTKDQKVITEQSYQILKVDIDQKNITRKFIENNDIEATFKIDHSGLQSTIYSTDLHTSNMSVKHKVMMEITLFEEEISYERIPYKKPIKPKPEVLKSLEKESLITKNTESVASTEESDETDDKQTQTKRLCADKTGQMQKLKTTFKLVLSETPKDDFYLSWEEDIPPIYECINDIDGTPPRYIVA